MKPLSEAEANAIHALMDSDGFLEPEHLTMAAQDEDHPCHFRYDWNDESCAQLKRIEVSQALIRFVRWEVSPEPHKVLAPYYVTDALRPQGSKRMMPLTRVALDEVRAHATISEELRKIKNAIHRALVVAAVLGLRAHFDELLTKVITAEMATAIVKRKKGSSKKGSSKKGDRGRSDNPQPSAEH